MPVSTVLSSQLIRYLTPSELESHCTANDCWIAIHGRVLNITSLIQEHQGSPLIRPLLNHAGQDVSHWFAQNGQLKTHIDPETGCPMPYLPEGRFVHVPPSTPRSDWNNDIQTPWWQNDKYYVGKLSEKTRKIRIVNTLTRDQYIVEVCTEETLNQIQERYIAQCNSHSKAYVWKRFGVLLDMSHTLEQNGVEDDSEKMDQVGINEDEWLPVLHLYFSDDLTFA